MPILDQVRDHVETGLTDEALLRLIDEATTEVEGRFGTDDPVTEIFIRPIDSVVLKRAADSITSVTVRDPFDSGSDELQAATDYRLRNGRILDLNFTTGSEIVVVYVPRVEVSVRDRVVIDLVRLAVQYEGLQSQGVGDYNMSALDYAKERERILSAVSNRRGMRFA